MKFDKPLNSNYCAVIVSLDNFVDLPGCDNVKGALLFGNQVIVSKDASVGDIGVFFPVECQLSPEFLGANNLFRKPESGNVDKTKKGYFEDHGRIRAVVFRGNRSEGFWIPLQSLAYLGIPLDQFHTGLEFDRIGDRWVCRKYVPNGQSSAASRTGRVFQKQSRTEGRLLDGQFRFHIDTEQLGRNMHRICPDSIISITSKWHGTSAIFSNTLVSRELSWKEKIAKYFGLSVQTAEYGVTWASRRVIKGIAGSAKDGLGHYYSSDIWGVVAKELDGKIPHGYTLYGEIVGYTPDGAFIQKGYHYGCQKGKHRFVVYRITYTSPDGNVFEFGYPQITSFCGEHNLEVVPLLYYGQAREFYGSSLDDLDKWRSGWLNEVSTHFAYDGMCEYNNGEVPLEGAVVRVERYDICQSYKVKSFLFKKMESGSLDKGEIDIESVEGECQ